MAPLSPRCEAPKKKNAHKFMTAPGNPVEQASPWGPGDVVVRKTFIDLPEPEAECLSGNSRVRASSCGEQPRNSAPLGPLRPKHTSKDECQASRLRQAMEKGRVEHAPTDFKAADGPRTPGLQPASQAGSCNSKHPRVSLDATECHVHAKREQGGKTQRVLNLESLLQCDAEPVQQRQPYHSQLPSHKQFQVLLGREHGLQHIQGCTTQQNWNYVSSQPHLPKFHAANSCSTLGEASTEAGHEGEPSWFDDVSDVEEALQMAWKFLGQMSTGDFVSVVRLVAKLADAEAWGNMDGFPALQSDARLLGLVSRIRMNSCQLETPRKIMNVMWAVGKIGLKNDDVESIFHSIFLSISRLAPSRLNQFSSQELSNVLWGLAKYCEMRPEICNKNSIHHYSKQLALLVLAESTPRLAAFSPQCLTNSLWAVAKMELTGRAVDTFGSTCLEHIHRLMFKEISPQGLANSIWACAKLVCHLNAQIHKDMAMRFCTDAARRAMASEELLKLFFPQELSMAIWGIATLIGRRKDKDCPDVGRCPEVEKFGLAVANEAMMRIREFSPQGLANIAWALATLDLVRHEVTSNFLVATATVAAPELSSFSPQAIANLLWAVARAHGLRRNEAIVMLGKASAIESQRRGARQFAWQDLAGVVSALTNLGLGDEPEIQSFAIVLIGWARQCCSEIKNQALMNIAQSAARLRVDPAVLKPFALEIAKVFPHRVPGLNNIDMRQWDEVRSYVNLMGPGCEFTPSQSAPKEGHAGRSNKPAGKKGFKQQMMDTSHLGVSVGLQ